MSKVIVINENRDYYCSMKFKYIKFDLERKTTYTCHAAKPHTVDFRWLEENPGQIFNNPININERKQMLANERNSSCEQNCWPAEDSGAVSPRLFQGGTEKTHTNIVTLPEIVDLTIGSDCNLMCLYCSKEYSSTWRNDIIRNGNYNISNEPDRYNVIPMDKVLSSIKQRGRHNSKHYRLLLDELILNSKQLKEFIITGGEPFLDNSLIEIISQLPHVPVITLYSGLGVDYKRFSKIVTELAKYKNIDICISAECIDKFLEFNRFGIVWEEFEKKIKLLEELSVKFHFQSTISNLTAFGFTEFYKYYAKHRIILTFSYQPSWLAPYVLDEESKECIREDISVLDSDIASQILKSIEPTPTEEQRINLYEFLTQFKKRNNNLDLSIYPNNFLKWIGINNVV